jgi:hypothetical protein
MDTAQRVASQVRSLGSRIKFATIEKQVLKLILIEPQSLFSPLRFYMKIDLTEAMAFPKSGEIEMRCPLIKVTRADADAFWFQLGHRTLSCNS